MGANNTRQAENKTKKLMQIGKQEYCNWTINKELDYKNTTITTNKNLLSHNYYQNHLNKQ